MVLTCRFWSYAEAASCLTGSLSREHSQREKLQVGTLVVQIHVCSPDKCLLSIPTAWIQLQQSEQYRELSALVANVGSAREACT